MNYQGTILFDNETLEVTLEKTPERMIGYLPQDVLMMPGTVAENIAGLRSTDSKQVVKVSQLVGIHDFILKFLYWLRYYLWGGYQNLSGGERSRLDWLGLYIMNQLAF